MKNLSRLLKENFIDTLFKRYFMFRGRATRIEFLTFMSVTVLIDFTISSLHVLLDYSHIVDLVYNLLIIIPALSVTFRRLNDADIPRYYAIILGLIPNIVTVYIIYSGFEIHHTSLFNLIFILCIFANVILLVFGLEPSKMSSPTKEEIEKDTMQ